MFSKSHHFLTLNISQTATDTAIARLISKPHVYGLSNRAIFNYLEQPQTQISRSGHSLTVNISEMAKHTAIFTMEGE